MSIKKAARKELHTPPSSQPPGRCSSFRQEIRGTIAADAGPDSRPYTITMQLPGHVVAAVSSAPGVISWQAAQDTVQLELAPGKHELTISLK